MIVTINLTMQKAFTLTCIHGNLALFIIVMYINKGDIYKNVSYKTRIIYS